MALTGRYRFRQAWAGMVLEVEHGYQAMWPYERHVRYGTEWRWAQAEDLYDPALRILINGVAQPESEPAKDNPGVTQEAG